MPGARAEWLREAESEGQDALDAIFYPETYVPLFRRCTPKTRFVILESSVMDALTTGSVYMCSESRDGCEEEDEQWSCSGGESDDDDTEKHCDEEEEEEEEEAEEADSGESERERGSDWRLAHARITEALAEVGGAACPKLGRVCPTDATWTCMQRNTRCESADAVLTMLASSERVLGSTRAGEGGTIALRKWARLDERNEFRVFVKEGVVVGVCARSDTERDDDEMDGIVRNVEQWYERIVKEVMEDNSAVSWYVLDLYIDSHGSTWLIDIGPWKYDTDALLFEWSELDEAPWMLPLGRAQFRGGSVHSAIRPAREVYDGLPLELRNAGVMESLAEAAKELMERESRAEEQSAVEER